jgi:hypothetical protein
MTAVPPPTGPGSQAKARAAAARPPVPPRPRPRSGWRSWEKAHHRAIMLVLEGIGAGIAGLLILVVLLAVRLDLAPLQVNFLTPQLVAWLNGRLAPLTVHIDHTSARWQASHAGALDLQLTGLGILDPAGRPVLSVPAAAAPIDLRALLEGHLRPLRLTIEHPRLVLVRAQDGQFGLPQTASPARPAVSAPGSVGMVSGLLDRVNGWFMADSHGAAAPIPLRQLSLVDADIEVDDHLAGFKWRIGGAEIDFRRHEGGFTATSRLTLERYGDRPIGFGGTLDYTAQGRALDLHLEVDPIDPSRWAATVPAARRMLDRLHLPIGGALTASATIDPKVPGGLRPGPSSLTLDFGGGSLVDPWLSGGTFPVARATLAASYDATLHRLTVDHAFADVGGPTVEAKATLESLPAAGPLGLLTEPARLVLPLTFSLTGRDVPFARLPALWPPDFHPMSRDWIVNHVPAGTVRRVDFSQTLLLQPGSGLPPVKVATASAMDVDAATIEYIKGLPPATGVMLTSKSDLHDSYFTVTSARIANLAVTKGTAHIDKLGDPTVPSWIAVDLALKGPVRDLVAMLDSGHLHLSKPFPFKPEQVDGIYDGGIHVYLPLVKDVPAGAVQYGAKATLRQLAIRDVAEGLDLSGGTIDLTLSNAEISVAGDGALDGAPARISYLQTQSGRSPHAAKIGLQMTLDAALRRRLKLEPPPGLLTGPVGVDLNLVSPDKRHTAADVALDLTPAALAVDPADWTKPAGKPGHVRFHVDLLDGHPQRFTGIDAAAPRLAFQGDAQMATDGLPTGVTVRRLVLGETSAAGSIGHDGAGWHVVLSGPAIDLAPFLKNLGEAVTPAERAQAPAVDLDLKADRLIFGPDRAFTSAHFTTAFAHENMLSGDLAGGVGAKGKAHFHLATPQQGGALSIASDDMGAFLNVVGISSHIAGGTLTLQGSGTMEGDHRRYAGHAEGRNYRVVRAPIMAKLLALASLSSISSQLSGKGIPFSHLSSDFTFDDGHVALTNGHAYGSAIGINGEGAVDLDKKTLSFRGSLVPAYMLNNALANIPIIGNVLLGGKGQGVFSANFAIGGSIDNPGVSVNPLSFLAPGAIRDIPVFNAPMPKGAPPLPSKAKTP